MNIAKLSFKTIQSASYRNTPARPQAAKMRLSRCGVARVKVGHKTGYVNAAGKYIWNPSN